MPLLIDQLIHADIPAAQRLSALAGWNQIGADWQRLLDLWPQTCLAGRIDGNLVATSTLAVYSDSAWLGMVLVDPAHQGRGHATALLTEILHRADSAKIKSIGLDATDQGRPLYLKHGFVDHTPITRWKSDRAMITGFTPATPIDWPTIFKLDRAATGQDRQFLLKHLATKPGSILRVQGSEAFAMVRHGRTAFHVGPIIAPSSESAVKITGAILSDLARIDPDRPVIIDVPDPSPLTGVLPTLGFQITRKLSRMFRPPAGAGNYGPTYAAACGFELG